MLGRLEVVAFALLVAACGDAATQHATFTTTVIADFDEPWAVAFLPDGRLLVTERRGALRLLDIASGRVGTVAGAPWAAARSRASK